MDVEGIRMIDIGDSVEWWEEENGDCCVESLPVPKFPLMSSSEYGYATWYVLTMNERFYRLNGS